MMSVHVGQRDTSSIDELLKTVVTGRYLSGDITFAFHSSTILPRSINVTSALSTNNVDDIVGADGYTTGAINDIQLNIDLTNDFYEAVRLIKLYVDISLSENNSAVDAYTYVYDVDKISTALTPNAACGVGQYPVVGNNGAVILYATDNDLFNQNDGSDSGTYQQWAVIHELLHTLGLYHPHTDFNGSKPVIPQGLQYTRFSVMNYTHQFDLNNDHPGYGYPVTPMPLDIASLQFLYGETNNNDGNTVYSFNNLVRDLVGSDGEINIGRGLYGIWDTSGEDTINFFTSPTGALINLNSATLLRSVPQHIVDMATTLSQSQKWASLPEYVIFFRKKPAALYRVLPVNFMLSLISDDTMSRL
jgi:hypothetical protein